ncbi:MAG: hypothetical protein M1274_12280 [Actinobacteria bacterium]|nr:hypothetical protein [Actinomycetota bacterium]
MRREATSPLQPVVYDMMLLADCLVCLREIGRVIGRPMRRHPKFCERQKNQELALIKIRGFMDFLSGRTRRDWLTVTEEPFCSGARPDLKGDPIYKAISNYAAHLGNHRWKFDVEQVSIEETISRGMEILGYVKEVLDPLKADLTDDAAHWYGVFERRHEELLR